MRLSHLVAAASVCVRVVLAAAGPLNPPAGALSASGKTLTEIEPRTAITLANTPGDADSLFKITQPGSYYLTGTIVGAVAKHGIEVAADFVTIDLNGFTMVGVTDSFDAVRGDGGPLHVGLTVKNGTISGWTNGSAVYAGGMADCRAADLRVSGVAFEGVWFGARGVIERCVVRGTRGGLRAGSASVVRDSSSEDATERGIYTSHESMVWGCQVRNSTGVGIDSGVNSTVRDCTVRSAGSVGVLVGSSSNVTRVEVFNGIAAGIGCGSQSTVTDCVLLSPGTSGDNGISTQQDCRVSGCTVLDAGFNGIAVGSGSTVTGCVAGLCSQHGINAGTRCTVSNCKMHFNTGDGVRADAESVVTDNHCIDSIGAGASGVRIIGNGCKVEGNECRSCPVGIQVAGTGSLIVRNTCSLNATNWIIAASNVYGPIVDRTVPASAAVSGNSAADTTGSTHPNANFTR
jgi:hypothetical protein